MSPCSPFSDSPLTRGLAAVPYTSTWVDTGWNTWSYVYIRCWREGGRERAREGGKFFLVRDGLFTAFVERLDWPPYRVTAVLYMHIHVHNIVE